MPQCTMNVVLIYNNSIFFHFPFHFVFFANLQHQEKTEDVALEDDDDLFGGELF